MKLYGALCIAVAVILLLSPMAALSFKTDNYDGETETSDIGGESVITAESEKEKDSATISVFMTASGTKETISMRDYIIGTVAAEMPASYEKEALKAQALAAVTFAEYMKEKGSDPDIDGADISDDSSEHQGYISIDEMKEKWGDAFDTYYEKIASAVDDVIDKVITYNGKPIMAAYHAISTGKTESAKNIWQGDVPYLQSVESEGDIYSSRYSLDVTFTSEQLKNALSGVSGIDFSCGNDDLISIKDVSDAGTVMSVNVGGKKMSGMELRNYLQLRSPAFSVIYSDDVFTFKVKGYGHGVGMSQFGADYYASQGMTCDEIIKHYYTGVDISDR